MSECPDIEIVAEACCGDQAYALVCDGGWNFLLLDISMPGRDAFEIIKKAKQKFPSWPILVMSMSPKDQYAIRMLRAGVNGHFPKDSALEQLLVAIRKLARGELYISAELVEQLISELNPYTQKPLHSTLTDREFQVFSAIAKGNVLQKLPAIWP